MTTVLIADDERDVRDLLRFDLEADGYRVLEACNGREALGVLSHEAIEVLLLDLRMPEVSGWDVLTELTQKNRLDGMNVIVISAHGGVEASQRALALGARYYLTKPFRYGDLVPLLPPVDD